MTALELMRDLARQECDRARKRWDDQRNPAKGSQFEADLKAMLGSGITQAEAAARLGCTRSTVSKMLSKKGWVL